MKQITNNDHKSRGLSRRSFLATTATVTSFMALPAHVLGLDGAASPNSKLNIAGIGIGGQGGNDIDEVSTENIVATVRRGHRPRRAHVQKISERKAIHRFS